MMQLKNSNGDTIWINHKSVDALRPTESGCQITLASGVFFNVNHTCQEIIELTKSF